MKYLILVAIFVGLVVLAQNADAQLSTNKAFSLSGTGFATTTTESLDATIESVFVTSGPKNAPVFDLQQGTITVGGLTLDLSKLSGTIYKEGKLFRITSTATGPVGDFTLKALGRQVDHTANDFIYIISGTLTDSKKGVTKLIFTAKLTQATPQQTKPTKSDVIIKILPGSANPQERTYKTQTAGFSFKYFSEDRLTIPLGTTVTFVNDDTTSHSLKSGTANYVSRHKTFTPDNKISSGQILPGKSWSVKFDQTGFYRLFDEDYQWMDMTIFVIDPTKSYKVKIPTN